MVLLIYLDDITQVDASRVYVRRKQCSTGIDVNISTVLGELWKNKTGNGWVGVGVVTHTGDEVAPNLSTGDGGDLPRRRDVQVHNFASSVQKCCDVPAFQTGC